MKVITVVLLVGVLGLTSAMPLMAPAGKVSAAAFNPLNDACEQAGTPNNPACKDALAQNNPSDPINGDNGILNKAVVLIAMIGGIGASIMVMLGGFKYITSGGDSQKVSAAKSQITSGLIGAAIVVGAYFILTFVVEKIIR